MITPEQIDALDVEERAALLRQLAEMQLPPTGGRAARRRFGRVVRAIVTVGAVALVPWSIYLALSLPRRTMTDHWRGAWVGFDLMMAGALAFTAWCGWHRRQLVTVGLTASAVLLTCDAWFDVMLTRGAGRWVSLSMALLVELPLAALFGQAVATVERSDADLVWRLTGQRGPRPTLHRMPLGELLAERPAVATSHGGRRGDR